MMQTIKLYTELFLCIMVPVLLVCAIVYLVQWSKYRVTDYARQTHCSLLEMVADKGRTGEYETYCKLRTLDGTKRFLFNVYIPKEGGGTSEIDVILLHHSGLYILESKNYSGWIFGKESDRTWTQSLPTGQGRSNTQHFLNPVLQNAGHIKWLLRYLKQDSLPTHSYIVFSDRCELKSIQMTNCIHHVVKRNDLYDAIREDAKQHCGLLSDAQIEQLFHALYPLSQATEAQKQAHIGRIGICTAENAAESPVPPQAGADSAPGAAISQTDVLPTVKLSIDPCPCCGGKLILRTARKGKHIGTQFYGCEHFPQCRFTRPLY